MAYRSYDSDGGLTFVWVVIIVVAVFVLFSGPFGAYKTHKSCEAEYTECAQLKDGYWYPTDESKAVED